MAMKLKFISATTIGATLLILTACQATQDKAKRAADMARDIQIAKEHFTEADKEACITGFKLYMNDPSSFELAGELAINRTWMDVTYGQTWDYLPPRRVIYTAPIRGKNKLGGLVLNEMRCIYGVTDTGISFAAAKSR